MKKIISIFLIAVSAIILSSCVVVTNGKHNHHFADLTFVNDTNEYITDWYAEDTNGSNYTKSSNWTPVYQGGSSTIYDLYCADYRVRFTYDYNNHPFYYKSAFTYVDDDTTFYLSDEHFYYSRSADGTVETAVPMFTLTDNKGNEIPLELVNE